LQYRTLENGIEATMGFIVPKGSINTGVVDFC